MSLRRVVWQENDLWGIQWGVHIFYKATINDPEWLDEVGRQLEALPAYDGDPDWALLAPDWWKPQYVLSDELLDGVIGNYEAAFLSYEEGRPVIYWVHRPLPHPARKWHW